MWGNRVTKRTAHRMTVKRRIENKVPCRFLYVNRSGLTYFLTVLAVSLYGLPTGTTLASHTSLAEKGVKLSGHIFVLSNGTFSLPRNKVN